MSSSSRAYFSKVFPMRLIAVALLIPVLAVASDDPFDPFNRPVSLFWWKASSKDSYVTTPERGYTKGYCHGVMLAYLNQLKSWCVPDEVTWREVQDFLGMEVATANIQPLTQLDIGTWIANAIEVRWPCNTEDS